MKKQLDPHVRAAKALTVFSKALDELREAVADHHAIADGAYAQSNDLLSTAATHKAAAFANEKRISKIAEFIE